VIDWPEGTKKKYLTVNTFSRPGFERLSTIGLVAHSVGVAGQHPLETIAFWESLKDQRMDDDIVDWFGSAGGVIGTDGQLYAAAPIDEEMYHVGSCRYEKHFRKLFPQWVTNRVYSKEPTVDGRTVSTYATPNRILLGVEFSHSTEDGKPTSDQEDAFVEFASRCMGAYGLNQIFQHNTVTGKYCHRWYVEHRDDWGKLMRKIAAVAKIQEGI